MPARSFLSGLWRVADPRITLASAAALFLGAAAAARAGPLSWPWLALTVAGVFCVEVTKNAGGEIVDFDSGADAGVAPEDRSPFSGGKRVLVDGTLTRGEACAIAATAYALALALGAAIAAWREPRVLWLGAAGAACAFFYHARPLALSYRGLGEAAVALCYGPLIAGGTFLVQRGAIDAALLLPSAPLGLMIAAFLWINEFPDYRADRAAGKRTLVVRLGRPRASVGFAALVALAHMTLAALPLAGTPAGALFGLAGAPLAARAAHRLLRHPEDTAAVVPAQGWTLIAFVLMALGAGLGLVL